MSPKLFEYKGISLKFYGNDHAPVHVHAVYADSYGMKVVFEIKSEKLIEAEYKGLKGYKVFAPAQLRDLKILIERYKFDIVKDWVNFFVYNKSPKTRLLKSKLK